MYIDSANYFCASSLEYNLVLYVINVSGYIIFRAILSSQMLGIEAHSHDFL